jgi:hypothetical protein
MPMRTPACADAKGTASSANAASKSFRDMG